MSYEQDSAVTKHIPGLKIDISSGALDVKFSSTTVEVSELGNFDKYVRRTMLVDKKTKTRDLAQIRGHHSSMSTTRLQQPLRF